MKKSLWVVLLFLISVAVFAQPSKPAPITAEKVLASFENAIHGKQAIPFSRVLMDYDAYPLLSAHLVGSSEIVCWTDGRFYEQWNERSTVDSKAVYDGKEFWFTGIPMFLGGSMDIGSRLRDSKALEDSNLVSIPSRFFPGLPNWRSNFRSFEVMGASNEKGKKAIVVRGVLKSGDAVNFYFDASTMLLAKLEMPLHFTDQSGEKFALLLVRYYSNYGEFNGWKLPRHVTEEFSKGVAEFALGKVQFDPPFDESKLRKPKM